MSIAGEVCALVRGAKDVKEAIQIAAEVFAIDRDQVVAYLQEYGLMDGAGQYRPPGRLTGKENTVERFVWTKDKIQELHGLLSGGKSPDAIAAHFNVTVEKVRYAIKNYPPKQGQPAATAEPSTNEIAAAVAKDLCKKVMEYFSAEESAMGYFHLGELYALLTQMASNVQEDTDT